MIVAVRSSDLGVVFPDSFLLHVPVLNPKSCEAREDFSGGRICSPLTERSRDAHAAGCVEDSALRVFVELLGKQHTVCNFPDHLFSSRHPTENLSGY